jgi:hypothetical protein
MRESLFPLFVGDRISQASRLSSLEWRRAHEAQGVGVGLSPGGAFLTMRPRPFSEDKSWSPFSFFASNIELCLPSLNWKTARGNWQMRIIKGLRALLASWGESQIGFNLLKICENTGQEYWFLFVG